MTTTMHPDDLELFEYVEGDLDETRRLHVAAHLAACERCAAEVQLLEEGKQALRESPLLALPPKTKDALLRGLPRQAERERAPFSFSPRRLVAVLVPVAVAAIAVTAIVSTTGNGESERAAAPPEPAAAEALKSVEETSAAAAPTAEAAPAEPAAAEALKSAEETGAAAAPTAEAAPAAEPAQDAATPSLGAAAQVRSVAGPPGEVVALLREKGFDASVVEGAVQVRGADPASVEQVLADRPDGDVPVALVP